MKQEIKDIVSKMLKDQYVSIYIEYDGSGDSFENGSGRGTKQDGSEHDLDIEYIDLIIDSVINQSFFGWEINDGAFGTFSIKIENGKATASIEHNERYIETNLINSELEVDINDIEIEEE